MGQMAVSRLVSQVVEMAVSRMRIFLVVKLVKLVEIVVRAT